jgi:hypothetical protein
MVKRTYAADGNRIMVTSDGVVSVAHHMKSVAAAKSMAHRLNVLARSSYKLTTNPDPFRDRRLASVDSGKNAIINRAINARNFNGR